MAVQEGFPVEIVESGGRIAAETAMTVAHWLRAGYLWEEISGLDLEKGQGTYWRD